MSTTHPPLEYKGRILGVVFLVAAQILVGFIHVIFGFWLLTSPLGAREVGVFGSLASSDIYNIYTIIFGVLTLVFAFLLWSQKRLGWIGTVTVLIFVIVADSLTLLDLPSIPGIPKFAGYGEITYSVLVTLYLLQKHVRAKYRIII
jgi:hypothetical protein